MSLILGLILWTAASFWFMGMLNGKSGRFVAWRLAGRGNPGSTSLLLLVIALPAYAIYTIIRLVESITTLKKNIKDELATDGKLSIYSVLAILTPFVVFGGVALLLYLAWCCFVPDFLKPIISDIATSP